MKRLLFFMIMCGLCHSPTLSAQEDGGLITRHKSLTEFAGIVAYYEFDNKILNLADAGAQEIKPKSTLSFRHNHLYSNGNYSDYYNSYPPSFYSELSNAGFTMSFVCKPEAFADGLTTLFKIEGNQKYFYINRLRTGELYIEFEDIANKVKELQLTLNNTNLPANEWANLTVIYQKGTKELLLYANHKPMRAIKLDGDFEITRINYDFSNARRGGVFQGFIDKLVLIDRPLRGAELQNFHSLMAQNVGKLSEIVDPNKKLNLGTDDPDKLLGVSGLSGYYIFDGNVNNLVKPDGRAVVVKPPFSYANGGLYVNGSYNDYYSNYDDVINFAQAGQFTVALACKFAPETEADLWGRYVAKIALGEGRVLLLARSKDGHLELCIDNFTGEYVESKFYTFKNTQIPDNQWLHLAMTCDIKTNILQVYLNGKPTKTAHIHSVPSSEHSAITFANRSNGNVFLGTIASMAIFNKTLNTNEIETTYKKMTASLGSISNMWQGQDNAPGKLSHKIDENWTYLPSCVRGVKAKTVQIECPDGARLRFMISANEEENAFFILENAFSPPLEDTESNTFDSCLQLLLTIAKERCKK